MAQLQGSKTSAGGRLDGSCVLSDQDDANIALGVGWGDDAPTAVFTADSNDQRGLITVTSDGASQAQATATVTVTFADGAYASTPFVIVRLNDNTQAVAEAQPTDVACTTTGFSFTHAVLPVDAKTYTYVYAVIA